MSADSRNSEIRFQHRDRARRYGYRRQPQIHADLSIFYPIDHAVAAQSNFVYHARNNEISWNKKAGCSATFPCNGISRSSAIRTNIEYHAKRRPRNFFRLPFSEVSTFRPRQMPNDSYESLYFFCDLLSSRCSGRRPFRLYNFLLEEIDFQPALQFPFKRPRLSHSQF